MSRALEIALEIADKGLCPLRLAALIISPPPLLLFSTTRLFFFNRAWRQDGDEGSKAADHLVIHIRVKGEKDTYAGEDWSGGDDGSDGSDGEGGKKKKKKKKDKKGKKMSKKEAAQVQRSPSLACVCLFVLFLQICLCRRRGSNTSPYLSLSPAFAAKSFAATTLRAAATRSSRWTPLCEEISTPSTRW